MIFSRSMVREFSSLALAVSVVLLTIATTAVLIRLLAEAASGILTPDTVIAFLGFSMLNYLPLVLSMTVYFAVLMTLIRCYQDSEMAVWASSGLSLNAWLKPVMYFAVPVALLVAGLSFYLGPWAQRMSADYQRKLDTRDDVSAITPGIFYESRYADRVIFVDKLSADSSAVNNVFSQSLQNQKLGIVVAQQGIQRSDKDGQRFLVLSNGRRYEGTPGKADYKVIDFSSYSMRIEPRVLAPYTPQARALPTEALLENPTAQNISELHWRLSLPMSVLLLAGAAIPLSYTNPRSGKSWNLIIALLVFFIYYNFINIFQAWTLQEKISPTVGIWPVHGAMLVAILSMFMWRNRESILQLFRRPRVLTA
ncbi:MAG: LPS export ABC transporter permease LptF [Burkholderiales bacterium]